MVKIASREKGQGKVLVCLHGYAGTVHHWEQVCAELSQQFRVVVPNLTNLYMGIENLSFTQQIDRVADYVQEQFQGETIFLAGISYGGAIAWGLISRYPHLIDKVIFINPMPPFAHRHFVIPGLKLFCSLTIPVSIIYFFLKSPFGRVFLKQAARVFRNLQASTEENRIERLQGRKLKFIAQILWKFSWILRSEDWQKWENELAHWQKDCLLIHDLKDPLFHSHFYEEFAQRLEDTHVVNTVHAGHISIVQQPKLIAGAMREYLLRDFYKEAEGYN